MRSACAHHPASGHSSPDFPASPHRPLLPSSPTPLRTPLPASTFPHQRSLPVSPAPHQSPPSSGQSPALPSLRRLHRPGNPLPEAPPACRGYLSYAGKGVEQGMEAFFAIHHGADGHTHRSVRILVYTVGGGSGIGQAGKENRHDRRTEYGCRRITFAKFRVKKLYLRLTPFGFAPQQAEHPFHFVPHLYLAPMSGTGEHAQRRQPLPEQGILLITVKKIAFLVCGHAFPLPNQ